MHFWIDKRSQQCGFGRSRVAASLSGTGSGVGLGFGHPPRRSSANKTNSRNSTPAVHQQQQQHAHPHHHQHHQHYHHHQPQQQQPQPASSSTIITTTADCHTSRNHQHHVSNNNHLSNGNSCQFVQQQQHAAVQPNLNNNAHHQYHQHNQHSNVATNAINNNNATTATTATSTAILTGAGTIATTTTSTTNNYNHHYARSATTPLQYPMASSTQLYHPQFGNMSVRHYGTNRNYAAANAASSHATCRGATSGITPGTTAAVEQYIDHQQQPCQQRQQHQFAHHAYSHIPNIENPATSAPHRNSSATVVNLRPNTTSTTISSGGANNHTLIDASDSQLLPTHLKCGMCASLVLATVFVVCAKFYFDHQGNGLEVLIFCAFSVTFFLAICTVTICRIPKGLMPARSGGMMHETQHHGRSLCALGPTGSGGIGGNGAQLVQSYEATAGPPPYHIAILLPEAENSKEVPLDDESPPPSYDKILI